MAKKVNQILSDNVMPISLSELIEVRKQEMEDFCLPNRQTIIHSRDGLKHIVIKSRQLENVQTKKRRTA